jgi:hypothetical protein
MWIILSSQDPNNTNNSRKLDPDVLLMSVPWVVEPWGPPLALLVL